MIPPPSSTKHKCRSNFQAVAESLVGIISHERLTWTNLMTENAENKALIFQALQGKVARTR
jgi:hypothetical protein